MDDPTSAVCQCTTSELWVRNIILVGPAVQSLKPTFLSTFLGALISLRPFRRIAFRGGIRILPSDHVAIARNGLNDPVDVVVVIRAQHKEFQSTRSLKRFEQDTALFLQRILKVVRHFV